jgi:hypothetical protein
MAAEHASKFTLQEIASPLAKVLEILQREENIGEVLFALAAPGFDRAMAIAKRETLLHLLHKIADNLPAAPAKRGKGKPTARDLYLVVNWLAGWWEHCTKTEFKRDWHKGKPATDATVTLFMKSRNSTRRRRFE